MGLICFGTNLLGSFALATRIYTPTTPRGYFSYAEPLIYFGTNERRRAASGLCEFAPNAAFVCLVRVRGTGDHKFRGKCIACERNSTRMYDRVERSRELSFEKTQFIYDRFLLSIVFKIFSLISL